MLRRAIGRATTSALGLILLAPVLALLPAAVLDIGPEPESRARFSVFPLALAALDPLIWTSLWNSVAAAVIVAVGSLVIGVALGGVAARFRFWGRPVFSTMCTAPAVVAPAFLAFGLLSLFGPAGPRGICRLFDSIAQAEGYSARMWPWLVWIWAALIQGVALVVLTTRSALGRMKPFTQDAARLAGARPLRIWWTLTWPTLRPPVVSAVYLVFMFNVADPAATLVLGLRRTLGFQMVATALGPDPFPRLAAIALFVLAITLAGRTLLWWRGGSILDAVIAPGHDLDSQDRQTQTATWPCAALSIVVLGFWSLLAWFPLAGLLRLGLEQTTYPENTHSMARLGIVHLFWRLSTYPAPRLLAHSALLGLGLAALLYLLAWRPAPGPVGALARGWRSTFAFVTVLVPPLVAGAGVLALGRTAMLSSRFFAANLEWPRAGLWMERSALALDPFLSPGLVLFLGACLAFLPRRLAIRLEPPGLNVASARRIEQLRIAGGGRGSAFWHLCAWRGGSRYPRRSSGGRSWQRPSLRS